MFGIAVFAVILGWFGVFIVAGWGPHEGSIFACVAGGITVWLYVKITEDWVPELVFWITCWIEEIRDCWRARNSKGE